MNPRTLLLTAAFVTLSAFSAWAVPPGTHVVISEVQTRGSAGGNDEFIELLNPTCSALDLSGMRIESRSSTATTFSVRLVIGAGTTLLQGGHYLIAGSGYDGSTSSDNSITSSIADAGVVQLVTSDGALVDAVGYYFDAISKASVDLFNPDGASSVSNLPHNNIASATSNVDVSLVRKASGTQDTDDETIDFVTPEGPSGPENPSNPPVDINCTAGIGDSQTPGEMSLRFAGRNPFHGSTMLAYSLPHPAHAKIDVYSVDGRRVATLVNRDMETGRHLVPLRLRSPGTHLNGGLYLVRLTAGGEQRGLKVIGLD